MICGNPMFQKTITLSGQLIYCMLSVQLGVFEKPCQDFLNSELSVISIFFYAVFSADNREINHHGTSVPANENKNLKKKDKLFYVR